MRAINRTKKYEKFVFSEVCKEIANSTGCTEKDAWTLLVNALAYNTVIAEILDKAMMIADKQTEA